MDLIEIKFLVEENPVALATIMDSKPNVVVVDGAKVVSENQVLITDNFMNQTIKDILNNKNVCLVVWDKNLHRCKLIGEAEYFTEGKWRELAAEMQNDKSLPAKGAILVKVLKIIQSK